MNFETLTNSEIESVMDRVPSAVKGQLIRENVVLAGGVIRDTVAGLPIKDLDIFCHSREQAERLALEVSPFVKRTLFAFSVDLGIPVQYVFYKDFTDAKDLVSQFDFRACCAGIYYTRAFGWSGVAVEGFHADCAGKLLTFMSQQKDEGKLTALGRALSFAKKGWTLSASQAADIILHWQGVKPNPDELFGVDFTYEDRHAEVVHAFRPCYGRI
jgi:hypothetical protein